MAISSRILGDRPRQCEHLARLDGPAWDCEAISPSPRRAVDRDTHAGAGIPSMIKHLGGSSSRSELPKARDDDSFLEVSIHV
jgi:hypothetical protein